MEKKTVLRNLNENKVTYKFNSGQKTNLLHKKYVSGYYPLFTTILTILTMVWTTTCWAHGGVTPTTVITEMKQQQQGPYASPVFRGKELAKDWLGFRGENYQNYSTRGIIINKISPDGLADSAHIKKGDIITAADTQEIQSVKDLDSYLGKIKEPTEVELTLLRGKDQIKESIYLVPDLREIAPEMAEMFQGNTRPKLGVIKGKMIAQSPMGKTQDRGQKPTPGMFMDEMMQRSPMGQHQTGEITIKTKNPLKNFSSVKLHEISLYKKYQKDLGISDEQMKTLHKLELEYKKKEIQNEANLKIIQLEMEELALQNDTDLDKLNETMENLSKLQTKKNEQILNLLKKYYSTISKEQRSKLQDLLANR